MARLLEKQGVGDNRRGGQRHHDEPPGHRRVLRDSLGYPGHDAARDDLAPRIVDLGWIAMSSTPCGSCGHGRNSLAIYKGNVAN
jgi:hypothetical protein